MKQLNSYIVGLNYKVFVHCNTFNQSAYIKDALNGFVIQQTNFPYVCMVMDDCSTDGEQQLLIDWMTQECDMENVTEFDIPDSRVIIVHHKKNKYCTFAFYLLKRNTWKEIDTRKTMYNIWRSHSTYIALCEGDDYWTDPLKLQKQVDFLESHPDFSMCCHGATVINETIRNIDTACETMTSREYSINDVFPQWQIPTASIVYRYDLVQKYSIVREQDFCAGDIVLILRCMQVGRVWGWAEHMSVYRMNTGGVTSRQISIESRLKMCRHYEALMLNFPNINKEYCFRYIAMVYYTKFRKDKKISDLWHAIKARPQYVIKKILHLPTKPRKDLFYQQYHC